MAEDKKKAEGMTAEDIGIGAATAATGIGLMNATHTNSELSAVDDILDYMICLIR